MPGEKEGIAGKVVVITGASSGLGEATARHLSALGARVVLGARRIDRLQALVDEITGQGGRALALAADVTDAAQVQALVDAAVERYGRVDVLVNNAGRQQRRLRCNQDRGARDLRGASAGGQAVEPSHDDHLAGRGRDGAAAERHGARHREGHRRLL